MDNNYKIAEYALDALKKAGADAAQCIVSVGAANELNHEGGEFSLMRTTFDNSVSMKALIGGRKGTIAINKLDRASIDAAAETCMASARAASPDDAEAISPMLENANFKEGVSAPDKDALFDAVERLIGSVSSDYPKIIIEQLIADHKQSNTLYLNSNGARYSYERGFYEFSSTFSAHEGETSSSFSGYGARFLGFGTPLIEFPLHRDMLRESEEALQAKSAAGKQTGTLIFTPSSLLDLFGTIFSNFISDSVIIDKTSPWKDMLGKQVADGRITVTASPNDPRIVCGSRITGDGYAAEDCTLIENGILKTFQLSQYGSRKTGFPRAGNYGSEYIVTPGDKSLAEMIAATKHGVLMGRFSGGNPGTNGDFSGVAKNSYLIENGRITCPLTETMISGNFIEMLKNLIDISRETVCTSYAVLPWMSFGGVTISGS